MKLGAYAVERDYSHYVAYATKTVLAIVGTASKGPVNQLSLCTSTQDLVTKFGQLKTDCYGLYAAQYFLSQASKLYFVRAAGSSACASTASITGLDTSSKSDIPDGLVLRFNEIGTFSNDYSVLVEADDNGDYNFYVRNDKGTTIEAIKSVPLVDLVEGYKTTNFTVESVDPSVATLQVGQYKFANGNDGISDITDGDPIKWHTIFSRFANEDRVEAGDIDTDWYEDDRPKVYNYIINRFGLEKTAYILAVGTLADKSVIDVIGKAFNVKYANTLGLKYEDVKNKEDNPYNLNNIANIKKEYDKEPQRTREEYSDLFYYYDGLVGCVVSQSQHPAGIIVSPITLEDNIGMFIGTDGQEILPIDMEECHNLGLIKFDILGLKSIGVIDKTCKLIGTNFPKAYQVNWEDQEVYEDMTKDHTAIFQFESDFAGKSLQTMQCKSVFDMSLVNACIRPSGESYRDMLLHKIPNKNPSEIIDKLLENNYGHLVYQEDTIAFLQQICGFSGSEADNVRRAIGRKQTDKLNEALPKILDGYCSKSNKPREIAEKEAKTFLKIIEDASSYQFGYNHSIAYTLLSYMCGYLRYYYPTEFCTSFLNCAKNEEDINNGTLLAHSKGCHIETPKFRFSTSEYGCNAETKTIYKGVGSIKNVGTECGDKLYNLKDNIYDTFVDLLFDIDENKCANKTDIDLLVKIDFFEEFGNINKLLCIYDIYKKLHKRSTFNVSELEQYGLEKEDVSLISEKTTEKRFSGVNIKELIKIISNNITVEEVSNIEHISYELGILGYTNYTDDSVDNGIYVISNMEENKYGTRFATLYNPKSAEYTQYKVKKSSYIDHPCDIGDIIKVVFNTQNKRKQVDGEWVEDKDNKETILKDYTIIKQFKVKED